MGMGQSPIITYYYHIITIFLGRRINIHQLSGGWDTRVGGPTISNCPTQLLEPTSPGSNQVTLGTWGTDLGEARGAIAASPAIELPIVRSCGKPMENPIIVLRYPKIWQVEHGLSWPAKQLLGILNDIDVFGLFFGLLFNSVYCLPHWHSLPFRSTCRNVLSQADFQQVHSDIETEQMLAVKGFRPTSRDLRFNYVYRHTFFHVLYCIFLYRII